ncbi:MAG: hypothetical protein ACR2NM_17580, partial [Bythopirellula sp.]
RHRSTTLTTLPTPAMLRVSAASGPNCETDGWRAGQQGVQQHDRRHRCDQDSTRCGTWLATLSPR